MDIRAIAFDVNGTLIDIITDEGMDSIYVSLRHYLAYQGVDLPRGQLKELYFQVMKDLIASNKEKFPEYDAVEVWRRIFVGHMSSFTRSLPPDKLRQIPLFLAEMHRAISRKRLDPYPNLIEVLDRLKTKFPMAIVSDAQTAYARGELHKTGLLDYFNPIIISGDYGYRKPDPRLFQKALDGLRVPAENTLFIGNDMYRDVFGARQVGMKTLMYNSDQGTKSHPGVTPDFTITDYRKLPEILGIKL